MRTARKLHLYTGVFFAPAIIFFALSGFFQSFGWHEEHDGKPPMGWVATISEIHKDQRLPAPPRPQNPAPTSSAAPASSAASAPTATAQSSASATATPSPASANNAVAANAGTQASQPPPPNAQAAPGKAPGGPARRPRKKSFPLQVFMGFLAVSLIGSTLVGVWMAFQIQRNTALILGLLLAGIVIPVAALFIGIQ